MQVEGTGGGEELERLVKETVGCTVRVTVVPPDSVPRSEGGKLQRVRDLREL